MLQPLRVLPIRQASTCAVQLQDQILPAPPGLAGTPWQAPHLQQDWQPVVHDQHHHRQGQKAPPLRRAALCICLLIICLLDHHFSVNAFKEVSCVNAFKGVTCMRASAAAATLLLAAYRVCVCVCVCPPPNGAAESAPSNQRSQPRCMQCASPQAGSESAAALTSRASHLPSHHLPPGSPFQRPQCLEGRNLHVHISSSSDVASCCIPACVCPPPNGAAESAPPNQRSQPAACSVRASIIHKCSGHHKRIQNADCGCAALHLQSRCLWGRRRSPAPCVQQ